MSQSGFHARGGFRGGFAAPNRGRGAGTNNNRGRGRYNGNFGGSSKSSDASKSGFTGQYDRQPVHNHPEEDEDMDIDFDFENDEFVMEDIDMEEFSTDSQSKQNLVY